MSNNNNETTTKFKVDISELKKAMQVARRETALAKSEFKAISSSVEDWGNSTVGVKAKLKELDSNLKSQKTVLAQYEDALEQVKAEYGENSAEAMEYQTKLNNQRAVVNKTEREIAKYTDKLKELEKKSEEAGDGADELSKSLEDTKGSSDEASGGFTILKGALADLVADGIRATIDALKDLATDGSKAYSQFASATGIATDEMGKWEDAIQTVYTDNFGDSLDDVAQKMSTVNQIMRDLSPDEMIKVTESAITLEETFGMDFRETIRGVQNLMTHFGMTSEEALDYISQGAQNGLNYTDELGDNIAEYSGKFAEAGYSAEEYFQLLQNGSDGGAYNLDKVNDAINEVTTRIGDGTIEDSLDMFSTGTQDVFKAWQNGEATQKDVIDSIVGDINNATSEQEKMNLSAKAFGTMAEDGGVKFISSLTSVGDAYDTVTGKAQELNDIKYSDIGSALSGLSRTLKNEILQPIADKIVPVVTDFLNWCIEHIDIVAPLVTGLATAFGVLATALAIQGLINGVQKAFLVLNATLLANPIVLIVAGIVALVTALVMLWKKNEAFRNFFINAWNSIKKAFDKTVTAISHFPAKVQKIFNDAINKAKTFVSNLASKGKEAGSKLLSNVVNAVKGLPSKILSIGGDVVAGLWNGISNKASWLKDKIKGFVGNVTSWLKKFFKIGSPSKLMANEIGKWIPAGISMGIEDNTKSLYGAMKTMGNQALGGLNSGLNTASVGGAGTVVNNFNQTINSPKQLSRLDIYRQSKNLLGYVGGVR